METSDYTYVNVLKDQDSAAMGTYEVTGWTNTKEVVVDEAKLYSTEDFNKLLPLLGPNPSLWVNAHNFSHSGYSIDETIRKMTTQEAVRLSLSVLPPVLHTLWCSNWTISITDRNEDNVTYLSLPSILALISGNILYVSSNGHLVPENGVIAAALGRMFH